MAMANRVKTAGRRWVAGFTLIELMVVVAIVAILAAIAYPSYTESVRRGNRAEATALLLEAQQYMERYYAANDQYAVPGTTSTAPTLPARLLKIPSDATAPRYTLAVTASASAFTVTATPSGSMASDKCGALSITNLGVKGRSATGPSVQDCWR